MSIVCFWISEGNNISCIMPTYNKNVVLYVSFGKYATIQFTNMITGLLVQYYT